MATPVLFEVVRRISHIGAFGMLMYRSTPDAWVPICGTLERTYAKNLTRPEDYIYETKIKDGLWHCSATQYHKGGYETYEVHIPHHTRILIHKGNWPTDSEGCILLGEMYTDFDAKRGIQDPALGQSGAAFKEFMDLSNGHDSFFIRVKSV